MAYSLLILLKLASALFLFWHSSFFIEGLIKQLLGRLYPLREGQSYSTARAYGPYLVAATLTAPLAVGWGILIS
jgi:hypothetical protein